MEKRLTKEEFLKDLWHTASEKPNIKQGECCVTCLVKFKNGSTELCVYFRNPEGWVCDDMTPKDFKNLLAELKNRLKISIFLWRKSCASR